MKHLIDLNDISNENFDSIYNLTLEIINNKQKFMKICEGKILSSLFFEPSTRTNMSFTAAMMRLGGNVIGFSNPNVSSTIKGESLKDTIIMMSSYSDILVIRSQYEGAAKAASLYSKVPVINAGDGGHLHPTQTLVDFITILMLKKTLNNMVIGICGDLKYGRTVHSLIKFIARYNNITLYLISSERFCIPLYIKDYINKFKNIKYFETNSLDSVIPKLDILYMTRVQYERFSQNENYNVNYCLDNTKLKLAKKDLIILHPLPRNNEISEEIDKDNRAVYFKQAEIGMYARMALLIKLLNNKTSNFNETFDIDKTNIIKCSNLKCITYQETLYQNKNSKVCLYCDQKLII